MTPRRKQKFGSYTGSPPSVDKLPNSTEPDIMLQVWKRIGDIDSRLTQVGNSSSSSSSTSTSSTTRWVDLTNGNPAAPELIFDALGQVIVVLEYI